MRSSFFEFYVATSALTTAQASLATVSHNIANASNDQYSRQYTMQKASTPFSTNNGTGMIGSGSVVYGVGQYRDVYLDQKYWTQCGVLGEYSAKNTQLTLMENVLNEMLETGIGASFDDFFSTIQDLTTSTDDTTYRTSVLQSAEQLASFINLAGTTLQSQQSDINTEVAAVVATINSLGYQISNLTEAIAKYEITGDAANDLRDQRAALVDELSQYVNVEVKEVEFNEDVANGLPGVSDLHYYVQINGYDFVKHDSVYELECVPRITGAEANPMDAAGLYDIVFSKTGQEFDIYSPTLSGQLGGLIQVRDGNNGNDLGYQFLPDENNPGEYLMVPSTTCDYKGIPYYMNQLNELVQTFAKAINQGVDSNGDAIPGVTGHDYGYDDAGNTGVNSLFTYQYSGSFMTDDDYANLNCLNFCVNPEILNDPTLMACYTDATLGESENGVILSFVAINNYDGLFDQGALSDYILSISTALAIDKSQADKFETNYTDVVLSVQNQRLAVSGVSLNEEMMDMVKYQQLYQAAAKLVTTIDEMYDMLINQVGAR